MGKKKMVMMKKLPSLFRNNNKEADASKPPPSSWQWPSCKQQPKTHSFRAPGDDILKTANSVYNCDDNITAGPRPPRGDHHQCMMMITTTKTPESWFTNSSSESASFSTVSEESGGGDLLETVVIRGLRSDRLFFEPGDSNSLLQETKISSTTTKTTSTINGSGFGDGFPFKESVVLAMESEDPYVDFRTSMEEMVEAHGLKNWECLEELLCWYLRVNGKKNHGFIVGAFVDLLVSLAAASAGSPNSSFSSSSSCLSSLECVNEVEEEGGKDISCLEDI